MYHIESIFWYYYYPKVCIGITFSDINSNTNNQYQLVMVY